MNKNEIITILEEIGTILELKGENPFKSRAYFNGARALETLTGSVEELILNGKIADIRGIGKALSEKLFTLVNTGRLPYYEDLKASIPEGLFDILKIPGLGPKKVKLLYDKLDITTIGELEYACKENRLRDLQGFGQRSQDKILEGIRLRERYRQRFLYPVARLEAWHLFEHLKAHPNILRLEIAGSLRRKRETIKDLDFVASCKQQDRAAIMSHFVSYEQTEQITGQGDTKSGIIVSSGMGADLRLVNHDEFAFALHHFSGSKAHNTALRQRAKSFGLTMNEYGLYPEGSDISISCDSEEEIFKALKLAFIEPELRENHGEIEAAAKKTLPDLVTARDIRGIFHAHSSYSDGAASILEMALACREMGYEYLGITDHSQSAFYANGLSEERIRRQHEEIDRLNSELSDFTIFKGIESDILADGQLDYTDAVLETFDFVIASVHSIFRLSEDEMTKRICRALENPYVTMLGHPTGRLLLGREAYPVHMETVLETAARFGKIVEINANPHRLDLDWRWGPFARERGIKTSINPDAHSTDGLKDTDIGVGIARKAWFSADEVLNTRSADEINRLFKNK